MADFAAIVRNGVATARSITDSLHVNVMFHAWIGQDFNGKNVYAAPIVKRALVNKEEKILHKGNVEVVAKTYLALIEPVEPHGAAGRSEPIDSRDKFTLPDGTTGPVVDVSGFMDGGTGHPYFFEVYLGE